MNVIFKKTIKLCGGQLQPVYWTVAWHIVSAIFEADLLDVVNGVICLYVQMYNYTVSG